MIRYRQGSELPNYGATVNDASGVPLDLSSGYTFTLILTGRGGKYVKTTGFTGLGSASSPNLIVAWAAGDLQIPVGVYFFQIKISSSLPATTGKDRFITDTLIITPIAA